MHIIKFSLVGLGLILALGTPQAHADRFDERAVIGATVGGALGAAIGDRVDGRHGAIVGAAIGGATGAAIGSRETRRREVVREREIIYVDRPVRYYYPEPRERIVVVPERPRHVWVVDDRGRPYRHWGHGRHRHHHGNGHGHWKHHRHDWDD
ncbi:glycine zipper domain-containing protein [Chitinivorax sp. B]|uniref:glycine zipper domain-containing protein n=1 Tax=Chitinivorax sp. B TaxID=2502235 RepID=UPI0010F8F7AA|nr:glycine zipper domain-containing protein [Chitinivorax sp. B]